MAKKIVIADYSIEGLDDIIEETGQLIKRKELLTEENKKLKKSQDDLTASGEKRTEVIAKNNAALKETNQQINVNTKVIQANTNAQKGLTAEIDREVKSIDQARANNAALIKSRNALVKTDKDYRKNVDAINKKIDQNNKFIEENVSQLEQQKIGIGDYAGAIKEALGSQTLLGRGLANLKQLFGALGPLTKAFKVSLIETSVAYKAAAVEANLLTGAQKRQAIAANIGTAAFKVLKLAIAATGIGLIIIAVRALFAAFSRLQPVIDETKVVFAAIGAAIDVLLDRLAGVGKILLNIFNQPFSQTLSDIKGQFAGINEEMREEIELAQELERRLQALRDVEIDQIQVQAQRRKLIEQSRIAAKDELKTLEERSNFLKTAQLLEQQNLKEQLDNARERAAISQAELDRSESSAEDIKKNAELQAAVTELEIASLKKQRSVETELQSLQKRGRAQSLTASKKAVDAALKENKERLALFIAQNKGRNKPLQEALEFEEELMERRLENLEAELEAGKINRIKFEEESLKIKGEFLTKQTELTLDNLDQELELFLAQNQSKITAEEQLSQALIDEEIRRLQIIDEEKTKILEEQRAAGLISELEYLTAKQEQENAFIQEQKELKAELEQQEKEERAERDALEFEESLLLLEEQNASRFQIDLAQVERQRQLDIIAANAEIQNAQNREKAIANITAAAEQAKANITAAAQNQKLSGAAQVAGGIAQLVGEETVLGKAASIAQATANTFEGVTKALTLTPPASYILAAITGAAGLATVAKIVGIKGAEGAASGLSSIASGVGTIQAAKLPKATQGMLIGPKHSQGGIPIEAEGGEGIINARSMGNPLLRNIASAINVLGGGVDFSTPNTSGMFADGGITGRGISENSQTQNLIDENISRIRVVNVARDTTDVATEEIQVENAANI